MATSGAGAIITEGEAYEYGHIYLSPSSTKALTYGKMGDNASVSEDGIITSYGFFAGSWITDDMRSTSSVTPPAINRYKCVKYSYLCDKPIRVPWLVKISEGVLGSTSANKIELRYYYKTSSTATEQYVTCGTWDHGGNISTSEEALHYFEANPYLLYSGTVYSSRLLIWCGYTNGKQPWKWRLRTKSGPTSGTWGSWNEQSSNATNAFAYPSGDFLYAMENYNGVEFYIG